MPTIAAGDDGALFSFLASSKQSVVADPDDADDLERVHALLARADAVVWSTGSRLAELPALTPDAIRRAAPAPDRHVDHAVRPGRAVERPRRDRVHAAGLVGRDRRLGRGSPDRAPVFVGGQIGEWLTGAYAAIGDDGVAGACAARRPGELVDVSMLETPRPRASPTTR